VGEGCLRAWEGSRSLTGCSGPGHQGTCLALWLVPTGFWSLSSSLLRSGGETGDQALDRSQRVPGLS
jgi:hypothetical protein